ncbi:MAG TPA: succinylglutamate desuccinylase/aspartoacylase family protein [Methylibium sp.]|nr:succinylglutamate desuccinylase/aspartoacylase family protein [Methylibium sp.]
MQRHDHPLPGRTPGTARHLSSFHYGPTGGAKVYVQAALHADELPGMLVAHHLREQLAALEAAGALRAEVIVVPAANPIGLAQWLLRSPIGRFELESGENFNRHYATLRDAAWQRIEPALGADAAANAVLVRAALREAAAVLPAETELAALRRTLLQLACDAEVVLDLHCDAEAVMHLYTGTALWPQCEPLARLLGAQATLLADESGDQPFDEACSQLWWELAERAGPARPIPLGCLSVTVELRGMADVDHATAAQDAEALLDFLIHRGYVDGRPVVMPALLHEATPLAGSMPVTAPVGGLLAWHRAPGRWVHEGEPLVDVIDPLDGTLTTLVSPVEGLFYARENLRFVTAGTRVAKVAGREARRSGKLLSA